ncbi:hypothetical protein IFM89_004490 [Coptis chinensis]|uniref:nicotinate-nucleotide diphosphorylase (carboxylating) n=1 Tax=Coptis chinensis TaxID=261450 RepID=A0A835GXB2_9MAGN|nr:hypothetical protein IFM89_004490 [Coptis chinensis]
MFGVAASAANLSLVLFSNNHPYPLVLHCSGRQPHSTSQFFKAASVAINNHSSQAAASASSHSDTSSHINISMEPPITPPYHPTYDLNAVIKLALSEDAGDRGDVTCLATVPIDMKVEAHFFAKEDGIIAGISLAEMIFNEVDPSLEVEWFKKDGDSVSKGTQFGKVSGKAHKIVVAERVVLNFMQRMSGIATLTKAMADAAHPACILETRKTAPGLRLVDKWAVLIGGGRNHRMGLFDMVMIKDNHISIAGGVTDAIKSVDQFLEQNQIETRTLEEVKEVLDYASQRQTSLTRIMLDNMVVPLENGDVDISMLKEAVELINGRFETEASGNVTLETVHKIGQSGVTYISSGALTHSVKALDISLKIDMALALKRLHQYKFSVTVSIKLMGKKMYQVSKEEVALLPQQLQDVESAVQALEAQQGVSDPTSSNLIEGRWKLIFTTRPGTASPIQRTFVGVDVFNVFQEVYLRTEDPRVSNIVQFSDAVGELKVEAAASINSGTRILFRFDRAAFSLKFLPFKVPYPVPFRLLGDEAKGWLDTTYLSQSGNIRISRGNKGTTFVLQKKTEPRQRLLSAISTGAGVTEAIDELIALNQFVDQGESEIPAGEWQLIWSSQMETDSWIENAANGLMGKQIVRGNGQIKFLIDILLGFKFSMDGTFVKIGSKTYDVTMDDAAILVGSFGLPMEIKSKFNLDLLYTDEKIRITRGYNRILFVHLHVDGSKRN